MTIASFYYQTSLLGFFLFFFFNDTATTEIYTLSLHDALPICALQRAARQGAHDASLRPGGVAFGARRVGGLGRNQLGVFRDDLDGRRRSAFARFLVLRDRAARHETRKHQRSHSYCCGNELSHRSPLFPAEDGGGAI